VAEPKIACPKCSYEIHLTESLAAPLLEAARKDFREQLTAKRPSSARKPMNSVANRKKWRRRRRLSRSRSSSVFRMNVARSPRLRRKRRKRRSRPIYKPPRSVSPNYRKFSSKTMSGWQSLDLIEPVGKGEFGGDIVQKVNGQIGAPAGVILWELKQTRIGPTAGSASFARINKTPRPTWP